MESAVKKIKREPDLLDFFAAYAMQTLLGSGAVKDSKEVAIGSFQMAERMISAREEIEKARTEK
jgi:hypothetical protein